MFMNIFLLETVIICEYRLSKSQVLALGLLMLRCKNQKRSKIGDKITFHGLRLGLDLIGEIETSI